MTKTKTQPRARAARINSDAVLKELLQAGGPPVWRVFFKGGVKRFLNIEFPSTKTRRVDLLVEETDGALTHLEFQGDNDLHMPWRELEYYALIFLQTGKMPRQIVIYVGRGKLRMTARIEHPQLKFEYILLDIRTIDAAPLIASGEIEANIIGFLCGNGATRANLRRILRNICRLEGNRRRDALTQLALVAGLRVKEEVFIKEATEMGLEAEIKNNLVLSGFYDRGRQAEGAKMLQLQLRKKFGELPEWVLSYLQTAKTQELEEAGERFVDATTLEEIFRKTKNGASKKARRGGSTGQLVARRGHS